MRLGDADWGNGFCGLELNDETVVDLLVGAPFLGYPFAMTAMQLPFTRDSLIRQVADGFRPEYLMFWGHSAKTGRIGKECLSQWYPARFAIDGTEYASAEHYMMAEKARLFEDSEALGRIICARTPAEAKGLGRSVRGYSDEVWAHERFEIVVRANAAKFSQNPELSRLLEGTGDRVLVEASPHDRVWGVGLAQADPRAQEPTEWLGLNLLGFALMTARIRVANRP